MSVGKNVSYQVCQFSAIYPEACSQKIWNASRICVSSLRRGHANLLCIVPILVYVFRRIHIFGCFSNLYTTIFSPPNCFFPPHEHFFSISIPFHCKTVPSRPPMQDIVTWNLLSKKNVAPFIILSYSNLAVDGRQHMWFVLSHPHASTVPFVSDLWIFFRIFL